MNYDLLFALIFYGIIILFFYKNRKNVKIHAKIIAFYRTKLGLKWMDKIAKTFPKLLSLISYISIFIGFAGMMFIMVILIKGTYNLLINGGVPALAPIFPGVKIPGLPMLGFWHWIVAIFFVAVVHEFSHGVFARLNNLKVKSSGFALFGPILAAFVEPDEKAMAKKSKMAQLGILSAGPFSNVVWGFIFLLIAFLTAVPLQSAFFESDGIIVNRLIEGLPSEKAGLEAPFVIYSIGAETRLKNQLNFDNYKGIEKVGNKKIRIIIESLEEYKIRRQKEIQIVETKTSDSESFVEATEIFKPDKPVKLVTNKGSFEFKAKEHPDNSSKGYVGIADFSLSLKIRQKFSYLGKLPYFVLWFNKLIFWLFIVNVGVGLFNLLPLGIVDGGRMFYLAMLAIVKDERLARKIWTFTSLFLLLVILINLFPYLMKLFLFLGNLG